VTPIILDCQADANIHLKFNVATESSIFWIQALQ